MNLCIVGAQWGDEGKGKIVDLCAAEADIIVRFGGGANAGHTLVVGDRTLVAHQLPSGIAHPGKLNVLGPGMVIEPSRLIDEIDELEQLGLTLTRETLRISRRAHLVLPYHLALDGLREQSASAALGTTRRGIGPAYEDKVGRRGVRVCDLVHPERLRDRVARALEQANLRLEQLGGEPLDLDPLVTDLQQRGQRLAPFVDSASAVVQDGLKKQRRILFEGAQGVLLDIDHGTYPYVTSSTTLAGGAGAGAGVGPRALGRILGVTKAYTTRVGAGPFPTEDHQELGERLRALGGEYGATTGRPRRCGWLDLPALRHAAAVGGFDALALTKLDVLAQLDRSRVCVGYRLGERKLHELPPDPDDFEAVEPIYRDVRGFGASLDAARETDQLPAAAREFIELVEGEVGVPIALISVGPRRDQTIVRADLMG